MKKTLILVCFGCLIYTVQLSAQSLPNTLLYRITGNGLQKPSYLYGTMHLSDKRLFKLGDSLLQAIQGSEGFAIEVDPNEISPFIVEMVQQKIVEGQRLKDMLDENSYKKYGAALSRKLKKPADAITTMDILREKNKWIEESAKKGKMQTFLDAYLSDLAYRQGKWIGGVEDMADQKGLVDNLIDESDIRQIVMSEGQNSKSVLAEMVEMYLNSDLNGIEKMMNLTDSAYRDALLVKRNKKMAWRMDSLSRVRTMVFAVGAAHLPGIDGLIHLLKDRGFNVSPVFSSKKILPENYQPPEKNIPWVKVDELNGNYHVLMPGKPSDINMYGIMVMKMYFNIFNSTGYLATSIHLPYDQHGVDSVIGGMAQNIFGVGYRKLAKKIVVNGIQGMEYEQTEREGYKHGYVLFTGNMLYLAVGFATEKSEKTNEVMGKFLGSFEPVYVEKSETSELLNYADSVLAYKIVLPAKPQSGKDLVGKPEKTMKSELMISVDPQSGSYYIFGVNQARPGYSFPNDSTILLTIHDNVIKKFKEISLDTTYIKNRMRIMELDGMMVKGGMLMKAFYKFRGNRWYGLVVMYGENKWNRLADTVLKSFEITDYPALEWTKQTSSDSLFSIWSPSDIKFYDGKDSNDDYSSTRYQIFDSTRSNTYELSVETFGKYFWQKNDSVLWNLIQVSSVTESDTLLSKKQVVAGNVKGLDIIKREKGALNISRKRLFLFGDTLYTLITTQQEQTIYEENVNKFFENFHFNRAVPVTNLYKSKATLLLTDLSSSDSATRAGAVAAIAGAPFSGDELNLLQLSLLKSYSDSPDEYETINKKIAAKIIGLKEQSSLVFAKEKYLTIQDGEIQKSLLDIISAYKTKGNYDTLAHLLLTSPPVLQPSYKFRGNVTDSLDLAVDFHKFILPLIKDTMMAPLIIDMGMDLVDSNRISISGLKVYQADILKYADWRYKKLRADSNDYSYADQSLVKLLGKFDNPACNAMLEKWIMAEDNNYLLLNCIKALAANVQQVNAKALLKLASDNSYRTSLYEALVKIHKQQLFPAKYLTQKYFAESLVYGTASEDDYEPGSIIYLSQKTINFQGVHSRFFFYKVGYGEEEPEFRLAVAGPFRLPVSDMSTNISSSDMYYEENYDASRSAEQTNALIRKMEGWYKWKSE